MITIKTALLVAGACAFLVGLRPVSAEAANYEALNKAKMSLSDAIEAVEKKSGGKVIEAEFKNDDGGTYEVKVLTAEKLQEYDLDANSGAVREIEDETIEKYLTSLSPDLLSSAKASLVDAIATTEKELGGRAAEADVDRSGDTVDYEIEIVKPDGSAREVTVDANGIVQ